MCNAEPNRFDHDLVVDDIKSITRFRYAPHNAMIAHVRFVIQKLASIFGRRRDLDAGVDNQRSYSSLHLVPEIVFYDIVRINIDPSARAKVGALTSIYVELSTDLLQHLQRLHSVRHLGKNIAALSNTNQTFPILRRLHFCARLKMVRNNRRSRRQENG